MSYYGRRSSSSSSSSTGASLLGYLLFMFVYFCVAKAGGCTPDEGRFTTAVRNENLKVTQRHGYDFFECGTGDVWVEGFTAKTVTVAPETGKPSIRTVNGTVCCGILKGCTIRWP